MTETIAPGLTADWLNAWLAAIGITVLVPDARLSWTSEPVPKACVVVDDDRSLADTVAAAIPTAEILRTLSIARNHPDVAQELPRNVSLPAYQARARLARARHDATLSACLTDLTPDAVKDVPHSPLDPPAPRGETLHDRVMRCHDAIDTDDLASTIAASLAGTGRRVRANGLGFDYRRLQGAETSVDKVVDPVIEVLAFFALPMLPIRGSGHRAQTRGWTKPASSPGAFTWPVWDQQLDCWAIDALLDRYHRDANSARLYGVTGVYRSVPFMPAGTSDVTRAYASERVW